MKKVLLLIISVLFAIQANAQTQEEAPAVTIDSLSTKLAELQHDYVSLYCDFELYRWKTDLDQLKQDIEIEGTKLASYMYTGTLSRDVYTVYSESYDVFCELYDDIKSEFEVLGKPFVMDKANTSGLTKVELFRYDRIIEGIERSMEKVELALKHYDACLKIYRDNM